METTFIITTSLTIYYTWSDYTTPKALLDLAQDFANNISKIDLDTPLQVREIFVDSNVREKEFPDDDEKNYEENEIYDNP